MSGEKRDEEAAGGTRENLKKKRELEEARKSGLIPAEKDEEGRSSNPDHCAFLRLRAWECVNVCADCNLACMLGLWGLGDALYLGREINPHIPQYIAKAPWYLHNEGPSLKHQRLSEHVDSAEVVAKIEKWYTHGLKEEKTSRKRFKPGSCTNCGATTHKVIDCVERPRQKGARFTGKDLAPDEYLPTESITDFEAKRDRWGGYDPASFNLIVEEYDDTVKEQQRRRDKNNATSSPHHSRPDSSNSRCHRSLLSHYLLDVCYRISFHVCFINISLRIVGLNVMVSSLSGDDDEAKIRDFDTSNAPIGTKDDRTRTTTRNLRIREDTAKYLINLNLDSAFYDPKTRSMREDPTAQLPQDLKEKLLYRYRQVHSRALYKNCLFQRRQRYTQHWGGGHA